MDAMGRPRLCSCGVIPTCGGSAPHHGGFPRSSGRHHAYRRRQQQASPSVLQQLSVPQRLVQPQQPVRRQPPPPGPRPSTARQPRSNHRHCRCRRSPGYCCLRHRRSWRASARRQRATNAAFPVCKPSIILVTSAPSVLVSPSNSLSNRASKMPPCAASKLVTSVWKVCRSAITAAVAAASWRGDGRNRLLSQRIGLRDEVCPEVGLRIVVEVFRRRVQASAKRRKTGNATLVCHVRQIGVALDDVDDVENIVVAGPSRIGIYSGLGDVGVLELELPYDRFGVNAGQPAEQQRVGGHQRLHVRDDGVHISC